jgi:hypothetical protein
MDCGLFIGFLIMDMKCHKRITKPVNVMNASGKQPTYTAMSTHLGLLSSTRGTYAEEKICRQRPGRET